MPRGEQAGTDRRDFVRWLADTKKHRWIAVPKRFRVRREWLTTDLKGAVDFWSFAEIPLDYEPRSLAVSPDGRRVAVGVKSGRISIARREGGVWQPKAIRAEDVHGRGPLETPRAIRGLLFLDNDLLVAGWGNGCFSIIRIQNNEEFQIEPGPWAKPELPGESGSAEDWYAGTQRISRLVPLFDPGRPTRPGYGPLVLAILSRPELCVLEKGTEGYSVALRSTLGPSWDKFTEAADAVWAGGALWVLTTHGALYRCQPDEATGRIDLDKFEWVRNLEPPRAGAMFRRLAGCDVGLAVLASENVAFFGFPKAETDKQETMLVSWFRVPGARELAVGFPYSQHAGLVWTVLSTTQPGLRWIGWNRSGTTEAVRNFDTHGNETLLMLAFGGKSEDGSLYLACGTRSHKLQVASVLDLEVCDSELSAQVKWLTEESKGEAESPFRSSAGLAWRCLVTQIKKSFGAAPPWAPELCGPAARDLFSFTDRNDLLQLSIWIVGWYGKHRDAGMELELARWALLILRRASEIDSGTVREVAGVLCSRLPRLWANVEPKDRDENAEIRLRSLANFLRKWVIYGHTYGEKRTKLFQLFDHNLQCGRKLDALFYLTRLMRKRADILWEAALPAENWVPPVWGVAADGDGVLSVASMGDGGLCAVTSDGRNVPWSFARDSGNRSLLLSEDRLRLQPRDAKDFAKRYRHGPYARVLWLHRLPGSNDAARSYVLVFSPKGWRPGDDKPAIAEPCPVMHALHLRLIHEGDVAEKPVTGVEVTRCASFECQSEIYGLCLLPEIGNKPVSGRFSCKLLAGTGGRWGHDLMPFVVLQLEGDETYLTIRHDPMRVERFEKADRHVVGRTAGTTAGKAVVTEASNNRCWVLTCTRDHGETWAWGGFQDGHIRGYRLEDGTWWEGGSKAGASQQRGLKATGPVWRLLAFAGPDGTPMLAYGTGDGVVGAVSIDDLKKKEPGTPVRFFLHAQERAPICGLEVYSDENDRRYLISVDQQGAVDLFDLNPVTHSVIVGGTAKHGHRFPFPGLRVDQFDLELRVRVLVGLKGDNHPPRFLVGSDKAGLHLIELQYPFYSLRRKRVPEIFGELVDKKGKGRSVMAVLPPLHGEKSEEEVAEHAHSWLRVLPVEDVCLVRFSLWDELRREGEDILSAPPGADLSELVKSYKKVFGQLVEETFRRRPFSEDLALALWEECGKVASCIARRILVSTDPEQSNRYLDHYYELNSSCADLCNRWIGVDQSVESIVLIDSFAALFDWTALTLITSDPPVGAEAQKVRYFLVYSLIQYRLSFSDTRVILETLRVINAAISRAIVNVPAGLVGPERTFRIRPMGTLGSSEVRAGFDDITAMVGDVWERQSASLSYSDPLTTEVTRFFSLALLLLPGCSLILGQVVSEGRLMERDNELVELIAGQAELLGAELGLSIESERVKSGLGRFAAYISEKVDPSILGADTESLTQADAKTQPWRYLLNQARLKLDPGPGEGELSDAHWLVEQTHVLLTIAWMDDLSFPSPFEMSSEIEAHGMASTVRWLSGEAGRPRFYRHTHDYLQKLNDIRESVRLQGGFREAGPGEERPKSGMRAIKDAIQTCEASIRELQAEHLFHPQRGHYQWVLGRWRDQLVKLAGEAVEVLDIMDSFNRHVYRRSADALMDNVVNLAMQTSPISYLEPGDDGEQSLRTRILKRLESYPLIHSVFESGEYLVQNTHLAGALLTIAREYTGTLDETFQLSTRESVKIDSIVAIVKEVVRRTGLSRQECTVPGSLRGEMVPGTLVVWDLIIQEWATNLVKHSYSGEAPARTSLIFNFEIEDLHDGRVAILLFSNVPYASLLKGEQHRKYKDDRKAFEDSLQNLFKPGKRENERAQGAGMGLFMIKRLAELERWAEMQVRLRLLGIERNPVEPLCLEITWKRKADDSRRAHQSNP